MHEETTPSLEQPATKGQKMVERPVAAKSMACENCRAEGNTLLEIVVGIIYAVRSHRYFVARD